MRIDQPAAVTCGSCRQFTLDPTDQMGAQGYGRCALTPLWQHHAPTAGCAFSPSRFEARAR